WPSSTRRAAARRCGARWSRSPPRSLWHNRRLRERGLARFATPLARLGPVRAVSSGVEHDIHTVGVGGSKPSPPTSMVPDRLPALRLFGVRRRWRVVVGRWRRRHHPLEVRTMHKVAVIVGSL